MASYIGVHCPVCDKRFTADDDIVVCPICGAPHHRACYQQLGHCALDDLHIKGHAWQPPQQEPPVDNETQNAEGNHSYEGITCPSCGAHNPPSGLFCQVCGAPLKRPGQNSQQRPPFYRQEEPRAAQNAYTTAFGGLSPDEKIGDVTARDAALYIGNNSHYFLPRFKQIAQKRGFSINWAAFFFNFAYFFYRKMYLVGGVLFILFAALQVPALVTAPEAVAYLFEHFEDISVGIMPPPMVPTQHLWAYHVLPYLRYISILIAVLCGFFANRLYFNHVMTNVRKIRLECEQSGSFDDKIYTDTLARRGRTSRVAVIIVCVGFVAAYMCVCFALAATIVLP